MAMFKSRWVGVFSWALVVTSALFSLAQQAPPSPAPAASGPEQFSAERALGHVREIARAPHPTGSPENERVRFVITSELQALGLEIIQFQDPACTRLGPIQTCANTRNLVGVLRGTRPNGAALLFSAHYDSVPSSPGAADDGAGVAALLEAARALRHSGPFEHDILFAFVDGEELLLLGASALVQKPEFQRVFLAVNFEARGNSGPSVLIDTTPHNAALIRHLAAALSEPALNSLYVALAQVLPNSTDAELYRRKGPKVLSFAIADGLPYYHHGTDTVEQLSLGSLQHHGQHTVDIARHFGSLAPSLLESAEDSVFFDIFGIWVVRYSASFARFSFFGLALLFFWVLGRSAFPTLKSGGRLVLGAGAFALGVVLLTLLTSAWAWLGTLGLSANGAYAARAPVLLSSGLFAFVVLSLARLYAGTWPESSLWAWPRLKLANYTLWLLLCAAAALWAPTASHLLIWPLFGALVAQKLEDEGLSRFRPLGFLPAALLLPTFVRACAITFGSGAAPILGACLALTFPWLPPRKRAPYAWIAIASFGTLLALALGRPRPSPPVGTSMSYVLPSPGHALFATADRERTPWHERFVPAEAPATFSADLPSLVRLRLGPAPLLDLAAPKLRLVEDVWVGETRRIVLHLSSPRRATDFTFEELSGAAFSQVHLPRTPVDTISRVSNEVDTEFLRRFAGVDARGHSLVTLHGIANEGTELELETRSPGELRFRLSDETSGLPEPLWAKAKRPPTLTTAYPGDTTRVVAPTLTVAPHSRL